MPGERNCSNARDKPGATLLLGSSLEDSLAIGIDRMQRNFGQAASRRMAGDAVVNLFRKTADLPDIHDDVSTLALERGICSKFFRPRLASGLSSLNGIYSPGQRWP